MTEFETFLEELENTSPSVQYGWSKEKEKSCDWLINRIQRKTRGVDIGGTEYICRKLQEKGCDPVYYDKTDPPKTITSFIKDDMENVLAHFPERSLDWITTRHTLEHCLLPLFQLWAYNRLLKDNGHLFVIVPSHSRDWVWFETHHNCLPHDNWVMLFYRAGFKIEEADAGTWWAKNHRFIEYRYRLSVETRNLRMGKPENPI
ncbi:methyltransferase domain-containing protein [Ectothiorhodospira haloalkaliphila]|uniref:methyltransferase domain-containing protein n=1 Tax=Ectothiorhodospira haloalkaliphila TaxID=421628 RepID=UPI00130DFD0E|nr:methyltransferase domain-containing protein [Ectothiorhodospira haloalkaliphila]